MVYPNTKLIKKAQYSGAAVVIYFFIFGKNFSIKCGSAP